MIKSLKKRNSKQKNPNLRKSYIIFIFVIMIGLSAHRTYHYVTNIHLDFTSNPEITCNIPDKKVFTLSGFVDSNGNIVNKSWDEEPPDPVVKIEAKSHGTGWAHILLYGNIDGQPKGDTSNTVDQQIGSWVGLLPIGWVPNEVDIYWEFKESFSKKQKEVKKEHSWDGSGSVKLVPVYWHWRIAGIIPSGEWKRAEKDFHKTLDASTSGTWKVEHNYTPIPPNATVPSPPQNVSVSPYLLGNGKIDLTWTASASDGGTPITDYEYKYCYYVKGYRGERGYWTSWTSWKSAGMDMKERIRGPRAKTEYHVRMRAVNSIGESLSTDCASVTTN